MFDRVVNAHLASACLWIIKIKYIICCSKFQILDKKLLNMSSTRIKTTAVTRALPNCLLAFLNYILKAINNLKNSFDK